MVDVVECCVRGCGWRHEPAATDGPSASREAVIRKHLRTHPLNDYIATVAALQAELDALDQDTEEPL